MVARALIVGSFGLAGVAGCSIERLELQGKACPCTDGYRCDAFTQRCVLDNSSDEIAIDTPDGGAYRIDATEVTAGAYQAFLSSDPDPAAQPAHCAWNTSFIPGIATPDSREPCVLPSDRAEFPNLPVRCVDWCDAQAYCRWKGRALCGRIGGGSLTREELNDPERGQWFRACSRGGRLIYPYGDLYDTRCNTGDPERPVRDVTDSDCEGGYPGLFDMSGNVGEWEDSCVPSDVPDSSFSEYCSLRGGAHFGYTSDVRCDSAFVALGRFWMAPDIGFRCCRG